MKRSHKLNSRVQNEKRQFQGAERNSKTQVLKPHNLCQLDPFRSKAQKSAQSETQTPFQLTRNFTKMNVVVVGPIET